MLTSVQMALRIKGLTLLSRILRKSAAIGFSTIALWTFAISAPAFNPIANGIFETATNGPGPFHNKTTVNSALVPNGRH